MLTAYTMITSGSAATEPMSALFATSVPIQNPLQEMRYSVLSLNLNTKKYFKKILRGKRTSLSYHTVTDAAHKKNKKTSEVPNMSPW